MNDAASPHRAVSRKSMVIAAFSTIVEWYDFTLYLYVATILSRVFFGEGAASLITTLGGFAIAYLMRPIGAIFFGHVGDRHGRRTMMLLSMAVMTAAMLATALLPTRAQIGPAAGWLLLLLRCVMGFSVGGEYTGVVAYLLEGAPPGRRGRHGRAISRRGAAQRARVRSDRSDCAVRRSDPLSCAAADGANRLDPDPRHDDRDRRRGRLAGACDDDRNPAAARPGLGRLSR